MSVEFFKTPHCHIGPNCWVKLGCVVRQFLVRSRPRDDFSSKLLSSWDTVLKPPVQSSMIFVRLGLFKSDYITRYLHTWVVLRLCISFTIGEGPRVRSKYSH